MAVTDWRAWIAQQGGAQPGQSSPFMFPGIGPLSDVVNGTTSFPVTPSIAFPNNTNTPTLVKPADPYDGWTAQLERLSNIMIPIGTTGGVQITSITPNIGVPAGGTATVINGTGFTGSTAVNFGATPGTAFSVVGDNQINVTSPLGTTKTTVNVTVVNPGGNGALFNGFSYS